MTHMTVHQVQVQAVLTGSSEISVDLYYGDAKVGTCGSIKASQTGLVTLQCDQVEADKVYLSTESSGSGSLLIYDIQVQGVHITSKSA